MRKNAGENNNVLDDPSKDSGNVLESLINEGKTCLVNRNPGTAKLPST
jgi:hypothetical protein